MKKHLTEQLACPHCKSNLSLEVSETGEKYEVKTGTLLCPCGQSYPIVDYVPRFVSSELYAKSFGVQWNLFPTTQLDSTRRGTSTRITLYHQREVCESEESKETFLLKTGLKLEDLEGKLVLDAGCGMGRFVDVCSKARAEVIGVDMSRAVEAAFRNVGFRDNVHVIQADIFNLPFNQGSFDIIFSIGVLDHTPNTRQAFFHLHPLLKGGGRISIWVYGKRRWRGKYVIPFGYISSDLIRQVTTRMSPANLLRACEILARLYPVRRIPLIGHMLAFVLPLSKHPNLERRILDNFDWYSSKYQWKHTYEEVITWFEEAGLTDIQALSVPVSVSARRRGVA